MAGGVNLPYPWIDGLTRRQQFQIYEDFKAVMRQGHGGALPTVLVANNGSAPRIQGAADYVCNGSNDKEQIEEAIAFCSDLGGGRVYFAEGEYTLSSAVVVDTEGTVIELHAIGGAFFSAADEGFNVTGQGHTIFSDMKITALNNAIESDQSTITVYGCTIQSTAGRAIYVAGGNDGGLGNHIYDNNITAATRGINVLNPGEELIVNNRIDINGSGGIGIRLQTGGLGFIGERSIVAGNRIFGAGGGSSAGVQVTWFFFDYVADIKIAGNNIKSFTYGIYVDGGSRVQVDSNRVDSCDYGIQAGGSGNTGVDGVMISNNFVSRSSVRHFMVAQCPDLGTREVAVVFNKGHGDSPQGAYAVEVQSGCTDNCVAFNDFFDTYSTDILLDNGTDTRREVDFFSTGGGSPLLPAGGTANYVLKKLSGADYDVDWSLDPAIDLAATKGDLLAASAADVLGVLPADRNGQFLIVDSTQTLGLKWGPKLTISYSAPASPQPGDIWIDPT